MQEMLYQRRYVENVTGRAFHEEMEEVWRGPARRNFFLLRMSGFETSHACVKHGMYAVVWKIHIVYRKTRRHVANVLRGKCHCEMRMRAAGDEKQYRYCEAL